MEKWSIFVDCVLLVVGIIAVVVDKLISVFSTVFIVAGEEFAVCFIEGNVVINEVDDIFVLVFSDVVLSIVGNIVGILFVEVASVVFVSVLVVVKKRVVNLSAVESVVLDETDGVD